MFTVSGRVINELAELTCAINFSLLFPFRVPGAKRQNSRGFNAGWRQQGEGKGREGAEGG